MNWPGATESAGKPPRLGSQPGVENRKVKVTTKVATAIRLPITAARRRPGPQRDQHSGGDLGDPIKLEVACTLKTAYSQDISGLFATSGWIAPAS